MRRAGRPPNIPLPAGKYRRLDGSGFRTLDAEGREVPVAAAAGGSNTTDASDVDAAGPSSCAGDAGTSLGASSDTVDGNSDTVPGQQNDGSGDNPDVDASKDSEAAARKKRAYAQYDKARYDACFGRQVLST